MTSHDQGDLKLQAKRLRTSLAERGVEVTHSEALEHLGEPYFRAGWGRNIVGMLLDADTDWDELAELLTDSYCVQAPKALAERVPRPG